MGFEQFIESVGQETIGLKTLFFLVFGFCLIYVQYFKKQSKTTQQKAMLLIPERKLRKKFLLVEDRLDALETRIRKLECEAGMASPPRFGAHDIHSDYNDEL